MGNLDRSDRHTVRGRPAGCHAQSYGGNGDDCRRPQGESAGHHRKTGSSVTNRVRTDPGGTGSGDGGRPHPGDNVLAQPVGAGMNAGEAPRSAAGLTSLPRSSSQFAQDSIWREMRLRTRMVNCPSQSATIVASSGQRLCPALARPAPTSTRSCSCTPSPDCAYPCRTKESRTVDAWSRSSSTDCATAPNITGIDRVLSGGANCIPADGRPMPPRTTLR